MNDDKIVQIEITLAHHEQQIQELNALVTEQWTRIERLKRCLDKALAKIDSIDTGNGRATTERPPHY